MTVLDMQGNPCPIPVVKARKELEKPEVDSVCVIVDAMVAVQNLEKMADGLGYSFSYTAKGENVFHVVIKKKDVVPTPQSESVAIPLNTPKMTGDTTLLISKNQMGSGSEELGKILIKGFIFSLTEAPIPPKTILFINSGVFLTTTGSNTLDDLKALESKGVEIFSCGTCLNYFSIAKSLEVGKITDMFTISEKLLSAGNTITL